MKVIFPDDFNRASTPIFVIVMYILSSINNLPITYPIGLILSSLVNKVLKKFLFKPIMGKQKLPILGTGTRPPGAKNCKYFRDNFLNNKIKPKPAKGYGFPSGHSQSAGFFISFVHEYFRHNPYIYYPSLLYSLYIPYTRVQFGCHTYQQAIFGFIFGIIFYYLFDYLYKNVYMKEKNNS